MPKKWKWVQLKSIFAKRPTVTPSVYGDSKVELWSIPAFDAGSPEIVEAKLIGSSKKVIVPGDVLLAKIVPHIKRAWVVSEKNEFIKLASTEWIVFHSERYFSEFLTMALTEPIFHAKLLSTISGMGSLKRANPKKLGEFYIPCPPIQEQIRIMEKLSKLKSIIDNYQFEHLKYTELGKRFPNQLKNSILQEAIQGRLVPQLESEPEMPQIGGIPENIPFDIPSKWKWMSLENVLTEISDGSHNPPPNSGKGVPVLSAKNINNGIIDTQLVTRWTTEEQWAIEDRKIHIEPGDVLLTIVGTIGRTAVVPDDAPKFMLQRSVCVMKTKNFLNSKFLSLMLTSPALLEWMMDRASGTAQKGIYLKALRAMPLPIPPLSEQHRIVGKLTELFNKLNQIDKLK